MFGINTLTIEAKVELRLIQCDPYHTWTFLNPSLTFKSDNHLYVFKCHQFCNTFIIQFKKPSLIWVTLYWFFVRSSSSCNIVSTAWKRVRKARDTKGCSTFPISTSKWIPEKNKLIVGYYLYVCTMYTYFMCCLLYTLADYWWDH